MRICLTVDLKDEPHLIEEYIEHHKNVWQEVKQSIFDSGITSMEIYHVATRLFMIIETKPGFSFEKKNEMDKNNKKVQEWESLMDNYQQRLPFSKPSEKWVPLNKILEL